MRRPLVALSIAVGLLLPACNHQAHYPADVVQNYMDACMATSGGNEVVCECTINQLQKRLSLEEFMKEDAAMARGQAPSAVVLEAVAACR